MSLSLSSPSFASALDAVDPLASFKHEFLFPKHHDGTDTIYVCGNSLGLQPRKTRDYVEKVFRLRVDFLNILILASLLGPMN